jgi:hypothetical protein
MAAVSRRTPAHRRITLLAPVTSPARGSLGLTTGRTTGADDDTTGPAR